MLEEGSMDAEEGWGKRRTGQSAALERVGTVKKHLQAAGKGTLALLSIVAQ